MQEIIHNILFPGSLLTSRQRAPLNFSGWKLKKKNNKDKLTIVIENRELVFPRSFIVQRGMTQNKKLLIQIAQSYKYCYTTNYKEKKKREEYLK